MRILPVNPRRGPNADIIHRARVFTLGFVAYPSPLPAHSLTRDFSLLPTPSNENEFPREREIWITGGDGTRRTKGETRYEYQKNILSKG